MITKIWSYLLLVMFNWYFAVGLIVGYVAKGYLGGPVISGATGLVVGIALQELIKLYFWK